MCRPLREAVLDGCKLDLQDLTFFAGRETIVPRGPGMGLPRPIEIAFAFMQRNAGHATEYFRLPHNAVVEIGREIAIRAARAYIAVRTSRPMHEIVTLIEHYGLAVVFLVMLFDQAGLPIPAFPAFMIAAALGAGGRYGLEGIIVAGTAGSLIADVSWFAASRRYGRALLALLCRISLSPDSCVRQTETMYLRVGTPLLLFAKFVPGLGIVSVALAAITGVNAFVFLMLDMLGALFFVGAAVLLGALFKGVIFAFIARLAELGTLGLVLVVLAIAAYIFARWWQRQMFIRQLRMDRISVEELTELIDRGEAPVILDVRPDLVRYEQGIIPGAIFAHPLEAQKTLAEFSKDIEVVVYCSCPNEEAAATAAKHLKEAGFRKIRPLLGGIEAWTKAGREVATISLA